MIFNIQTIKRICSGGDRRSIVLFLLDGVIINGAYYATILSLFSFIIFESKIQLLYLISFILLCILMLLAFVKPSLIKESRKIFFIS